MNNQLSKSLMCVQMRSGVEIWLEAKKAKDLQDKLQGITGSKFVYHEETNQTINTADIVGVFTASTMAENTRRKNGEWQCKKAVWHKKNEQCACHTTREFCDGCNSIPCHCD